MSGGPIIQRSVGGAGSTERSGAVSGGTRSERSVSGAQSGSVNGGPRIQRSVSGARSPLSGNGAESGGPRYRLER